MSGCDGSEDTCGVSQGAWHVKKGSLVSERGGLMSGKGRVMSKRKREVPEREAVVSHTGTSTMQGAVSTPCKGVGILHGVRIAKMMTRRNCDWHPHRGAHLGGARLARVVRPERGEEARAGRDGQHAPQPSDRRDHEPFSSLRVRPSESSILRKHGCE